MKVSLKFFASVREALGSNAETLELPASVTTVGELRLFLIARGGAWELALAETRALRMAVNQQMTDAAAGLHEGCEVAFFPPVTGG